jgi:hypothetical protein
MLINSHNYLTNFGGVIMLQNKMITCVFILICFFSFSFSQSSTKVGIGVAIIDMQQFFEAFASEGGSFNSAIMVPIEMSSSFRLEPEVGFSSATDEQSSGSFTSKESTTSWRIGVGLLGMKKYSPFTLYYGARVGYITLTLTDEDDSGTDELSSSGFYVAPALGGEHYFSDHFSLGGEAQIIYASVSTEPDEGNWEQDLSAINTRVLVYIRFFF